MVKTYLKYQLSDVLGQITGKKCKPVIDHKSKTNIKEDSKLYCASNDYIILINLFTGAIERKFQCLDIKVEITCLCLSEDFMSLAVGFHNGSIAIVNLKDYLMEKKFFLHKSEISTLKFLKNNLLGSGSKDTNIFIWDIIGEQVLYKLIGHKGSIVKLDFYSLIINEIDEIDALISCGKDNLIKIWNIRNQECIQTISDLINKISDIYILNDLIILGCFDNKLRLYQIHSKTLIGNEKLQNFVTLKGMITRKSSSKIIDFSISTDKKLISVLSGDSSIEFFKILNDQELKKRLISIEKNKLVKKEKLLNGEDKLKEIKDKVKLMISKNDYNFKLKFFSLFNFLNETKIKSIFFMNKKYDNNKWDYGLALENNSVEVYELKTKLINENLFDIIQEKDLIFDETNLSVNKNYTIDNYGHRDILRYVKFGDNDNIFLTSSNDCVKLWNLNTKSPIKTIELPNIVCGVFLFNDRYIVLGSRKGHISIYESNSLSLVKSYEKAHSGEIWNICKLDFTSNNNEMILISGSSDKTIKYWKIKCNSDKVFFKKMANIVIEDIEFLKSLDLTDQLSYCLVSPAQKFLCYSLLDNSIRVIYEDTHKNCLSLYGHKLPVLHFDISSDETLLVSASADKNVKLWGLDYGDCHKSFFAHQDAVTCVKFVRNTHYFFSSSKDKAIRYWDGDSFDLILEFTDFFADIWSLDINSHGTVLLSVSADQSIKIYELTKEAMLVDDEREKKIDNNIEIELEKELEVNTANAKNNDIEKITPLKKTLENLTYAEDLMESLDSAEKFRKDVYQYEINLEEYTENTNKFKSNKKNLKNVKLYNLEIPDVPVESPFLLGKDIFNFILEKMKKIRYSELENTLNNIPYSYVQILFFYLEYFIRNNIEVEISSRCVNFLINLFESQISNDKTVIRYLESIKINLRKNLKCMKDLLLFNNNAINLIIREHTFTKKSFEDYKNDLNSLNTII